MKPRLALAPAILVAFILCFEWRLIFSDEFTWLERPAILEHSLPLMQFQSGEIHKYRLPLWDPYTGTGRPLLGWNLPSPAYLLHTLVLALPHKTGWMRQEILHWYFVLILCAIALAMYAFARRALDLAPGAAVFAGAAYALAAANVSQELYVLHACVWVPLAFRYALRPSGNFVRLGVCLGMCWLPGSLEVPLATSASVAALLALWLVERKIRFVEAAGSLAIAALVGAMAILPGLQFGTAGGFHWLRVTGAPGVVLLGLAIAGIFANRNRIEARALFAIAACSALCSSPLVLLFACAAAAAWGLAAVPAFRLATVAGLVGAVAILGSAFLWTLRLPGFETGGPALFSAFLLLALAVLLAKGSARTAAAYSLLLALIEISAIPLWTSRLDKSRPRNLEALARDSEAAAFLQRSRGETPRVMVDPAAVTYDFGPWYGIETVPPGAAGDLGGAAFLVSHRPGYGFDRLLYRSLNGANVYGLANGEVPPARMRIEHDAACTDKDLTEFSKRLPMQMTIDVIAACPGWLRTGSAYSPGWQVTVDGKPGELTQQGIAIPAGKHRLEMAFRPISFLAGAALTSVTLICLGLARLANRR